MKKILLGAIATILAMPIFAKTLRVNNTPGSGAQYTTFEAAMEAAEDGDVIIVDGSLTSYGDIEIDKRVTVQGPGYFLEENGLSDVGNQESVFGIVTISTEGAKITGLCCATVYLQANEITVTRCKVDDRIHTNGVTRGVIHQNFLGSVGGSKSFEGHNEIHHYGTFFQITNNIFKDAISFLDQSVISRNSFNHEVIECNCIVNCTYSYNLAGFRGLNGSSNNNSFVDNIEEHDLYGFYPTDVIVKEKDAAYSATHGAFSGDDPYVLAGKTTGVHIKSVSIPESVVQGETLEGHITIELSR